MEPCATPVNPPIHDRHPGADLQIVILRIENEYLTNAILCSKILKILDQFIGRPLSPQELASKVLVISGLSR